MSDWTQRSCDLRDKFLTYNFFPLSPQFYRSKRTLPGQYYPRPVSRRHWCRDKSHAPSLASHQKLWSSNRITKPKIPLPGSLQWLVSVTQFPNADQIRRYIHTRATRYTATSEETTRLNHATETKGPFTLRETWWHLWSSVQMVVLHSVVSLLGTPSSK